MFVIWGKVNPNDKHFTPNDRHIGPKNFRNTTSKMLHANAKNAKKEENGKQSNFLNQYL
jgi:hypothetical protein